MSIFFSAEEGIADVAVIHDCFGALAPQVQRFQQIIRREMPERKPTLGYEPTREAAMAAFAKSWRRE
jgi:hypothetical protein